MFICLHMYMSVCDVPCRTVSYCVVLCRTVSYCVVPCRTVSYRVVPCRTVSYCVVLCRTVSCCVVLCRCCTTPCTTLYDASYIPDASCPDALYDTVRRVVRSRRVGPRHLVRRPDASYSAFPTALASAPPPPPIWQGIGDTHPCNPVRLTKLSDPFGLIRDAGQTSKCTAHEMLK